jgi:hypothetical protein
MTGYSKMLWQVEFNHVEKNTILSETANISEKWKGEMFLYEEAQE